MLPLQHGVARLHGRCLVGGRSQVREKDSRVSFGSIAGDLVEQVSPGPYLEMFARRNRLGWDTWGNESLNHVDLEGAA